MENIQPTVELELYIVRHAQSMGNAGYNGKKELTLKEGNDPVLTEKGIAQAVAAGEFLSEINFDEIYSSPLLRAAHTAAEIAKRQPAEKILRLFPELCEIGIDSEYNGADFAEISELYPKAEYADGVLSKKPYLCHEMHDEHEKIYQRAQRVMDYIRSRYKNGEKILLVSHAAFITNLVLCSMGFNAAEIKFDLDFHNTGITKIIFYKPGTNKWGDTVFGCINDTSHYLLMK